MKTPPRASFLRTPRPSREALGADTRGAIYVEFLIAFIPFFTMFLGMVQIALAYGGNLVVQHAATAAARAAVVVLPDDPRHYNGEPVNQVSGTGGGGGDIGTFLRWAGLGGAGGGGGGGRMDAIFSAASLPLLAVSPSMAQVSGAEAVGTATGGDPGQRATAGAAHYNQQALAVSFPGGTSFGPDQEVTVRVTYQFHCGVPVASGLLCKSAGEVGLGMAGGRFLTLEAEASLRNHGAPYRYRSGGGGGPLAGGP